MCGAASPGGQTVKQSSKANHARIARAAERRAARRAKTTASSRVAQTAVATAIGAGILLHGGQPADGVVTSAGTLVQVAVTVPVDDGADAPSSGAASTAESDGSDPADPGRRAGRRRRHGRPRRRRPRRRAPPTTPHRRTRDGRPRDRRWGHGGHVGHGGAADHRPGRHPRRRCRCGRRGRAGRGHRRTRAGHARGRRPAAGRERRDRRDRARRRACRGVHRGRDADHRPGPDRADDLRGTAGREARDSGARSALARAVLAWFGVAPGAVSGPSAPSTPAALLLAQWAWFRRGENPLFNQSPVVRPGQTGGPSTGEVVGTVEATDPDRDRLTYTLAQAPSRGRVVVNRDGSYVYTPDAELARTGGTVTFTVAVRDNDPAAPGLGGFTGLLHDALAVRHPALADRLFGAHVVTTVVTVDVTGTAVTAPDPDTRTDPATGVVTGHVGPDDGIARTYTVTTPPGGGGS